MALLEVKNLEVFYGVIQALKGISFEVNEGEIVTLIGANGAGKTTTMQSVIGLIPSKAGTVTYDVYLYFVLTGIICSSNSSQLMQSRRINPVSFLVDSLMISHALKLCPVASISP